VNHKFWLETTAHVAEVYKAQENDCWVFLFLGFGHDDSGLVLSIFMLSTVIIISLS